MPAYASYVAFAARGDVYAPGGCDATSAPRPTRCSQPTSQCAVPTRSRSLQPAALLAHRGGVGLRVIATDLDVPHDTVRSWLRRITGRAEWIQREATVWAHRFDREFPPITPTGSRLGDALEALGVAVAAHPRDSVWTPPRGISSR